MRSDVTTAVVRRERGSVLVIVLVICLGLATLLYYFSDSVSSDLQAAANRAGQMEAQEAVAAGARYAAYVLKNYAIDGAIPNSGLPPDLTTDYYSEALQVGSDKGDPQFWFIGRDPNNPPSNTPVFCLVDEGSKLNLNGASASMLDALPMTDMTTDFGTAIVAWRTRQSSLGNSAADNNYSTMDPPRLNKGAPFESVDELRLVYGATLSLLFGEDTNRNGTLDPNEDDSDQSPPHDNQDGTLEPGMLEYVTTFSTQPTKTVTGSSRINIANRGSRGTGFQRLLSRKGIKAARVTAILRNIGASTYTSVADFYLGSRMTADEFAAIHTSIIAGTATTGLVNVNTASETVLACIPGIGPNNATSVVAYRLANPNALTSFAWLSTVLGATAMRRAGPYITDQTYRFSADIAAVGRFGRGYYRERVVFDTSSGTPRIIYRENLTSYGWALGSQVLTNLRTASP